MSATITAQIVLDQNGYAVYAAGPPVSGDFTLVNVEYMIDDAIDTVNLMFSQSMANLSGTAGSKSVSVTRQQNSVLKMLLALVLRENKKTQLSNSSSTANSSGGSHSVSAGVLSMSESSSVSTSINAASAINNPTNSVYVNLFMEAGKKLEAVTAVAANRSPPIYIGNAPIE
jgi:hypothetical protein